MGRIKIARIVTIPYAFVHIKAFLVYLKNKDVEIELISSDEKYREVLVKDVGLDISPLEIKREISIKDDLISLLALIRNFNKNKYDIAHSSTPKAGLLTALAGVFFPRIIKIHTFTGQRWATLSGNKRRMLKFFDKLIIKLNDQIYADSPSQIQYLIDEGVAKRGEVKCINLGSYGGVNTKRFDRSLYQNAREDIINQLKLDKDSFLILYAGRITKDKGIEELVRAFLSANNEFDKLKLILIGDHEKKLDPLDSQILLEIKNHKSIFHLGFKSNPELFFSACDLFCLPSYREGFGTVVLEAAACKLPTIGTNIPGLVDSIVDGETGILVELKNVEELKIAILKLYNDRELLAKYSENAYQRAIQEFDSEYLAKLQWEEYEILLKMHS